VPPLTVAKAFGSFGFFTHFYPLLLVAQVFGIRAKNQLTRVIYLMHCYRVLAFLGISC
jgi:hypothetical protein